VVNCEIIHATRIKVSKRNAFIQVKIAFIQIAIEVKSVKKAAISRKTVTKICKELVR